MTLAALFGASAVTSSRSLDFYFYAVFLVAFIHCRIQYLIYAYFVFEIL